LTPSGCKWNIESFLGAIASSRETVSGRLEDHLRFLGAQIPNAVGPVGKFFALHHRAYTEALLIAATQGTGRLAERRDILAGMDVDQIQALCSAFLARKIVDDCASMSNPRYYADVYLDALAFIYQMPPGYVDSWLGFLAYNPDPEQTHFAARLFGKQYREISRILGFPEHSIIENMFWTEVSIEMDGTARALLETEVQTSKEAEA
jgi:hypothetical protein